MYCADAQSQAAATLFASQSAVVLTGTVVRIRASEEPLLPANDSTIVIKVANVLSGRDIVGDQSGRLATVVLAKAGTVKAHSTGTFFGNPRFVGKTITITDVGEIVSPPSGGFAAATAFVGAVSIGTQQYHDAPIRARLDIANLVFTGTVESEHALVDAQSTARQAQDSNPEWHVATVRVATSLRGSRSGQVIFVIFSSSRSVGFINKPKLVSGESALIIAHAPSAEEQAELQPFGALTIQDQKGTQQIPELVTSPYDVLPPDSSARVLQLLKMELK